MMCVVAQCCTELIQGNPMLRAELPRVEKNRRAQLNTG